MPYRRNRAELGCGRRRADRYGHFFSLPSGNRFSEYEIELDAVADNTSAVGYRESAGGEIPEDHRPSGSIHRAGVEGVHASISLRPYVAHSDAYQRTSVQTVFD